VRRRFVSGKPTCVGVKRARHPFKKSMSWRRCVVGALILFKLLSLAAGPLLQRSAAHRVLCRHYTMNAERRPALRPG
jgi:hypothetical protein